MWSDVTPSAVWTEYLRATATPYVRCLVLGSVETERHLRPPCLCLQLQRQTAAPFATDATVPSDSLASVEAQLLSLNVEKEALTGSIARLQRSATTKKRTILDEKTKAEARLEEIEGELSKLRLWLRRNCKT